MAERTVEEIESRKALKEATESTEEDSFRALRGSSVSSVIQKLAAGALAQLELNRLAANPLHPDQIERILSTD